MDEAIIIIYNFYLNLIELKRAIITTHSLLHRAGQLLICMHTTLAGTSLIEGHAPDRPRSFSQARIPL